MAPADHLVIEFLVLEKERGLLTAPANGFVVAGVAAPLIRKNHPMRMQLSMFCHNVLSADY